jgi:hypothetical protein
MWFILYPPGLSAVAYCTFKFPFIVHRETLNFWGFGRKLTIECARKGNNEGGGGNAEYVTDVGKVVTMVIVH